MRQRVRLDLIHQGQAVAADDLAGAFQQMPGDDAGGQPVPVVSRPAVAMHHRCEVQTWVSHAPGNHDVCALAQRLDDGQRARDRRWR